MDGALARDFLTLGAALVGCGHVSGLLMRRGWPLALMLCADRVPIESSQPLCHLGVMSCWVIHRHGVVDRRDRCSPNRRRPVAAQRMTLWAKRRHRVETEILIGSPQYHDVVRTQFLFVIFVAAALIPYRQRG